MEAFFFYQVERGALVIYQIKKIMIVEIFFKSVSNLGS